MFPANIFADRDKAQEDEDKLYELLGCDPMSSTEQILAEYRKRIVHFHPDKCGSQSPGCERQFLLLQRAKEVLTDPERRANYDRWRNSGLSLSYRQWMEMAGNKMHASMHWVGSSRPRRPAIDDKDPGVVNESSSTRFRCDSNVNTSQSLLEQFRNYKI